MPSSADPIRPFDIEEVTRLDIPAYEVPTNQTPSIRVEIGGDPSEPTHLVRMPARRWSDAAMGTSFVAGLTLATVACLTLAKC